jgi:hypothetical protein
MGGGSMFKRNLFSVWIGILMLSGMFLMGQDSWCPDEKLLAYYSFETDASSSTGTDWNGTISGNVVQTSGKLGNSYHFDGTGSYILVNNRVPNGSYTFMAWVKSDIDMTAIDYIRNILDEGDPESQGPEGTESIRVGLLPRTEPNQMVYLHNLDEYYNNDVEINSNPITPNEWVHVAAVYDQVQGTVSMYLNGDLVDSKPAASFSTKPNYVAVIGSHKYPAYRALYGWIGNIDEVYFYGKALTSSEISDYYSATK